MIGQFFDTMIVASTDKYMLFTGWEVRIGKKLCPTSRVRPEAAGRGPYSRQRAQFLPIRTDQGR